MVDQLGMQPVDFLLVQLLKEPVISQLNDCIILLTGFIHFFRPNILERTFQGLSRAKFGNLKDLFFTSKNLPMEIV